MDGYSLTEKMRQARRRFRFTATEQALFYELVAICNAENWRDTFDCSNIELCFALSINEKTLIKAREMLINAELIYYQSGKSKRAISRYSFTRPFKATTVNNTVDKGTNQTVNKGVDKGVKGTDLYKQETKTKTIENNIKEEFEKFRKLYPGAKRGLDTEFENFKKKHKDYQEIVFLLCPALENLIQWHKQKEKLNQFVPEYANLQTWINQKRWEVELEQIQKGGNNGYKITDSASSNEESAGRKNYIRQKAASAVANLNSQDKGNL